MKRSPLSVTKKDILKALKDADIILSGKRLITKKTAHQWLKYIDFACYRLTCASHLLERWINENEEAAR